ncbi:MAG TPA: ABC transporter ATP-binding protein [Anaerolineae bacterium]|nr:ABC transporter ATP-binding protein [Anaerolineae bacterium]
MSIVAFDHVSKRFTLHRERSRSFQDLFLALLRRQSPPSREDFWALRDVSFSVARGEMLGLVGSNGAGKSTVLKLISRIIEPTSGHIEVNGRLGALLELGTGMHPELTGRENIYLNGAFVGFSRREITRRIDEIITFSEMERFIDVPVKHYSSGMHMRLGFAIAIQFEPELLLVDEVLAVGDQAFQYRCLDRVQRLKRNGVAVLLVTHARETVRELCDRAIWLDEGRIQAEGVVDQVMDAYMAYVRAQDHHDLTKAQPASRGSAPQGSAETLARWGSREAEITLVQLLDGLGNEQRSFKCGEPLVVRIHYLASERIERPQFGIAMYSANGFHINGPNTVTSGLEIEAIEGAGTVDYCVDHLPLTGGSYLLSATIYDHDGLHAYDHHHQGYRFRVYQDDAVQERYGSVIIPSYWRLSAPAHANGAAKEPTVP